MRRSLLPAVLLASLCVAGPALSQDEGEEPAGSEFIDMPEGPERNICTIWTFGENRGVLRCDPHPAWSFDFRKIAFNGAPDDRKGVFIADVGEIVGG